MAFSFAEVIFPAVKGDEDDEVVVMPGPLDWRAEIESVIDEEDERGCGG